MPNKSVAFKPFEEVEEHKEVWGGDTDAAAAISVAVIPDLVEG